MSVVRAAEVPVHHLHGSRFTPLIRPSSGSAEVCVWKVEVAPATAGVPHRILREEAFVLLDGAIALTIDGVTTTLAPGDAAVAPTGSTIALGNDSDGPATVLVSTTVGFTGELLDGTVVEPPWAK
ncbi:cupin domain-containing protein [Nocardia otitidiscaviarum]|uniref:cupin domain-containing protein n=1 Tax=Nocardia otitidiscaviarum TaxID=1823 RepID=UPI00189521D9|nr:cupin domain-containing protein [Nocardia otitidiscaviarum]MBF6240978.1 cupin domain-containing protein [Nocardia otitidiscaviarum]